MNSTYTKYLLRMKNDNNCFDTTDNQIRQMVSRTAVNTVLQKQNQVLKTTFVMKVPKHSGSKTLFRMKPWISDSGTSKVFSRFRCLNAGLGNRGLASNKQFYRHCPLCEKDGVVAPNNEVHLLVACPALESYRAKCGVGAFLNAMRILRPAISLSKLYSLYLSDCDTSKIKQRALSLYYMLKAWHDELGIDFKF